MIDDWKIEEPKTKDAATVVRKLRLDGTVLVVLAADELAVERSFANLPAVQTTTFAELSAHDVIRADWLVFSDRTLPSGPSDFSGTHGVGGVRRARGGAGREGTGGHEVRRPRRRRHQEGEGRRGRRREGARGGRGRGGDRAARR